MTHGYSAKTQCKRFRSRKKTQSRSFFFFFLNNPLLGTQDPMRATLIPSKGSRRNYATPILQLFFFFLGGDEDGIQGLSHSLQR